MKKFIALSSILAIFVLALSVGLLASGQVAPFTETDDPGKIMPAPGFSISYGFNLYEKGSSYDQYGFAITDFCISQSQISEAITYFDQLGYRNNFVHYDCPANYVCSDGACIINDADGDGVEDADDMCPGSIYVQDYNDTWIDLGTNRLADVNKDGVFETYHKKTDATSSAYSLIDTYGCSCADILTEMGDTMKGHWKHGCSTSVVEDWINMQTPALLPDGEACYTDNECQAGYCNPTLPSQQGYYGSCGFCESDADCTFPGTCDIDGDYGPPGLCIA